MDGTILRLEDICSKMENEHPADKKDKVKKRLDDKPRGKPKSGRVWKAPKNRFKSIIKTRGYKLSNKPEKLLKLREDLKRVKLLTAANIEARKNQIEERKERRRENLKRQEENRKKSEIVQVIKNSSKIKRMRKKQLRLVEKRDTTKIDKNQ